MTPSTKAALAKSTRIQIPATREDATALAAATAALIIERDRILAEKNDAQENVALPYAVQLDALDTRIDRNEKTLVAWAVANRDSEFNGRKSITLAGHKLVFREGTGKTAVTGEKCEDDVIDAIIAAGDDSLVERFLTVKTALDKNAILQVLRAGGPVADFFRSAGLDIVKVETCKFEPDLDAAEPAQAHAAA